MSARVFVSASVSACVFLFRGAPNIRVLQRQELMQDSLLLIAGFICGLKTQTPAYTLWCSCQSSLSADSHRPIQYNLLCLVMT